MKRRAVVVLVSCLMVVVALACAKAPEARTNATPESGADAGVSSALAERAARDATAELDARVPGLPMPQKFPHFVWDAAGAPPRDAAAH